MEALIVCGLPGSGWGGYMGGSSHQFQSRMTQASFQTRLGKCVRACVLMAAVSE